MTIEHSSDTKRSEALEEGEDRAVLSMAEYRSLFPVRGKLCSNKQFQPTSLALRASAAAELRR